jgi:hypothetical protein
VTARLLNRSGNPMNDLPVAPGPGTRTTIEVPLTGLATGDYLVEIKAGDASSEVTELIGFRLSA